MANIGGAVIKVYTDIGKTGTDTRRLNQLLTDAQNGEFNAIICNDRSRFARNQAEITLITAVQLPKMGIRFIAIRDNYDSAVSDIQTDFLKNGIVDMFNEYFPLQTSIKTRAVKQKLAQEGKQAGNMPYGYKKDPNDKYRLVVDSEAAEVVRLIFELRLQRLSYSKIAMELNNRNIPTAGQHSNYNFHSVYNCWRLAVIWGILTNRQYLGHTVKGKTTTVSYKDHTTIFIPESEWIVVENTHEAIVTKEMFDEVQSLIEKTPRIRTAKSGGMRLFSGLLKCEHCGKTLLANSTNDRHDSATKYYNYQCPTHRAEKRYCKSHFISERKLEGIVSSNIAELANGLVLDEQAFREQYANEKTKNDKTSVQSRKQELGKISARLENLGTLIKSAYENAVIFGLDASRVKELISGYQAEEKELLARKSSLEKSLTETIDNQQQIENFINALKQFAELKTLDREILVKLIDSIEIPENGSNGTFKVHFKL